MSYITRDEAKGQLSIHPSVTTHDDRIDRLIAAAERWAKNFLNVDSLDDLSDSPETSPLTIPEDAKSALLMHVEAEFDRDEKNFELLLKRAEDMLWPYRTGLGV